MYNILHAHGQHGGGVVRAVGSQREGPQGVNLPASCSLSVRSVCAWVSSGVFCFLPQSKDLNVRLTGDLKLSLGVNVDVHRFMSVLALRWTGDLSRAYLAFHPLTAGIGSSPPPP